MAYPIEYEKQINYLYNESGNAIPSIPVRLSDGKKAVDTNATVDSGAEFSLFRAGFSESFGIELQDGVYQDVSSINADFSVFRHRIKLIIFGNIEYELNIGFSNSNRRNLLGRDFLYKLQFGIRDYYAQMFFRFES